MLTATIRRTPILGKMFDVDESTGLSDINTWPAMMIMTSFVWLIVAILLGALMPVIQMAELDTNLFYSAITLHGAALAFPFLFQFMMGISLHRSGGCMGKSASGKLTTLIYLCMNGGAVLLTLAVLGGLKITYTVMYPLPLVGAQMGAWSMNMVVLGFTGIALVLTSIIFLYPLQIIRMSFFGKQREELLLSARTLKDPGMLGMVMSVMILLVTGTPLMIVAGALLLALYGIVPLEAITWASEPVVFQYVFYIFAHNLMEAMAIMVISAVYATLPLYLADGTRKLYSDKLANLALWILLVTSVTSFFHHFYTTNPGLPSALAYHGNFMSWATGVGAALSTFTILATIWKHGIKPEPGLMAILAGFVVYILDGVNAMVAGNIAVSYQIHGTLWVGGHAMSVLIAMCLMWMGVLYHHYPVITGKKLDKKLGSRFVTLYFIGAVGLLYSFAAGGAMGMPRRFADWGAGPDGWMMVGIAILIFGLFLIAGFVTYMQNFMRSRSIS
ncbi:cbb3-type cytochrome c oxidase subunit I [Sedimenticola selenatireducens]|uniref:cbb3-type cytochrome c oxidase subunit I n=1 Tax=Sedimenticola selenatireducens TaxID=191960 RepID=UPI002AAB3B90|nr:cbb3-type cytochrome c oxidase subunit I [Sedimenticola selenatireducens]